jgi:hypothetical protein
MTTLIPKYDVKNGGSTPTGAINRPINEKLAETLSVKDFGAIGNGVADDTAAIQAAINATPLYGILIFPNGIYNVSTTLNLPQSIGLVGGEVGSRGVQQAVIKWTATGGTMFSLATGSTGLGTSFKGLRLVNNSTTDMTIIAATQTQNLLIEECIFSGVGLFTHAIILKESANGANNGSFDTTIRNCTFANASVYIYSASNDTKIIDNAFYAEIANYAGAMLFASNNDSASGLNSLLITNNNFEGTLTSSSFFIDLTLIIGTVITNNRIEAYTGGTLKLTQMIQECTIIGNFMNVPYVYSGSRATTAHNSGQSITEFSNFIPTPATNLFTEVNNIQGVFSTKNLFDVGNINTDWYFGNCSFNYVQNGSLGFRSPVLQLTTPTSGTASSVEAANMIQEPELQLAIANQLFTTTVFIVKALSTNVSNSVVLVNTGDTVEYWTVPKDSQWHVIKVVRRMQTGDTTFQPTAYLSYASSFNAADQLLIAGIGVWVGTGAFELPFFNSWTQSPASASNTYAWVTGEIVQNMSASTTGNPVGFVCTASGTPGTWRGYGALI